MPVSYILKRSARKTLSIKVEKGQVYVYAPLRASQASIDKMVLQHQDWIEKKLENPRIDLNFNLETDEYVYVLGHQYHVHLQISPRKQIAFTGDEIYISGRSIKVMDRYFREYLMELVRTRAWEIATKLNVNCQIEYRLFHSKWGCCYANSNRIVLNYLLGCTPQCCIDEVICHELTHFKVNNHQKAFYNELSKIYPDYKKAVKLLKNYSI